MRLTTRVYRASSLALGPTGVDCAGGALVGSTHPAKTDDANNKAESLKCIDGPLFLATNIGSEGAQFQVTFQ
ncbi:hypothetical protein [Cognatishimia activa]|uniref:hypothetical protein n=1 Tax=Cognatishimia activa TaxID=1715691 RepID=UPI001FD84820|nr:hypothetical protein [Cognatishimia activa]